MDNKFYDTYARKCKEIMKTRRQSPKGSLKDIVTLIKGMESGDYTLVYKTNLYQKHSAEYCEYLEVIGSVVFGR